MTWSSLIHQILKKVWKHVAFSGLNYCNADKLKLYILKSDEDQLISQTTSQYPLKHTETTQEETAAPGKLPETPLRMDPDLLDGVRYDEFDYQESSQPDNIQMKTPPKELISSYSVSIIIIYI